MIANRFPEAAEIGMGLKVRLVRIEPAMAKDWLKKNAKNNRPATRSRVKTYTVDMRAGRWRLSDQPVTFDVEGQLINGQKRLLACVEADVPFLSLVVWGLPKEAFMTLDGAQRRTTAHNAKIAGKDWPRGAGATVRRIFVGLRTFSGRAYSDQEIDQFMASRGEAVSAAHLHLVKGRTVNAVTRAVFARAWAGKADRRRLGEFARVLSTGLMVPGDEAAVFLRNYILEESQTHASGPAALYALAEPALAAFLRSSQVKALPKPTKVELFPLPDEGYWDDE